MIPTHLLNSVDVHWHDDLVSFIDSGEASPEFLEFLDRDPHCQHVVEVAFTLLSQDIQAVADDLRNTLTEEAIATGNPAVIKQIAAEAFSTLTHSLQVLPADQQRMMLNDLQRAHPDAVRELWSNFGGEGFGDHGMQTH